MSYRFLFLYILFSQPKMASSTNFSGNLSVPKKAEIETLTSIGMSAINCLTFGTRTQRRVLRNSKKKWKT